MEADKTVFTDSSSDSDAEFAVHPSLRSFIKSRSVHSYIARLQNTENLTDSLITSRNTVVTSTSLDSFAVGESKVQPIPLWIPNHCFQKSKQENENKNVDNDYMESSNNLENQTGKRLRIRDNDCSKREETSDSEMDDNVFHSGADYCWSAPEFGADFDESDSSSDGKHCLNRRSRRAFSCSAPRHLFEYDEPKRPSFFDLDKRCSQNEAALNRDDSSHMDEVSNDEMKLSNRVNSLEIYDSTPSPVRVPATHPPFLDDVEHVESSPISSSDPLDLSKISAEYADSTSQALTASYYETSEDESDFIIENGSINLPIISDRLQYTGHLIYGSKEYRSTGDLEMGKQKEFDFSQKPYNSSCSIYRSISYYGEPGRFGNRCPSLDFQTDPYPSQKEDWHENGLNSVGILEVIPSEYLSVKTTNERNPLRKIYDAQTCKEYSFVEEFPNKSEGIVQESSAEIHISTLFCNSTRTSQMSCEILIRKSNFAVHFHILLENQDDASVGIDRSKSINLNSSRSQEKRNSQNEKRFSENANSLKVGRETESVNFPSNRPQIPCYKVTYDANDSTSLSSSTDTFTDTNSADGRLEVRTDYDSDSEDSELIFENRRQPNLKAEFFSLPVNAGNEADERRADSVLRDDLSKYKFDSCDVTPADICVKPFPTISLEVKDGETQLILKNLEPRNDEFSTPPSESARDLFQRSDRDLHGIPLLDEAEMHENGQTQLEQISDLRPHRNSNILAGGCSIAHRAPKLVDCQPSLSHSASAHFDDTQSDGCGAASQVFEFSQRLICPSISDKVFLASPDPEKSVDNVSYSSPATPQQFADSHCTTSENANSMTRRLRDRLELSLDASSDAQCNYESPISPPSSVLPSPAVHLSRHRRLPPLPIKSSSAALLSGFVQLPMSATIFPSASGLACPSHLPSKEDHRICFGTESVMGRSSLMLDSYYDDDAIMGNSYRSSRKLITSYNQDDSSGVSSCCTGSEQLNPTHRVHSAFIPRHDDEILLDIGDAVHVERECEDHWCYGTNLRTSQQGIFPAAQVCEIDIVEEICTVALSTGAGKTSSNERDTFYLTMLASIEVAHHKGNDVLVQAMNKVLSLYSNKEEVIVPQTVLMEVSFRGVHIIDKRKKNFFQCPTFDFFYSLQNISFCGAHPKQLRYFGFITKHPLLPRFACHVFLSSESTQPIVEAVGRAFKRSYNEYMAFAHPTEDIYLE